MEGNNKAQKKSMIIIHEGCMHKNYSPFLKQPKTQQSLVQSKAFRPQDKNT